MAERRDIPDALRDAVERTVQATVDTRGRAQGAVDDLAGSVDDIVRGAEKSLGQRRRSVRAAVGDRLPALPASHEDLAEVRAELRVIAERLKRIEARLPAAEDTPAPRRSPRRGGGGSARKGKPASAKGASARTEKARAAGTKGGGSGGKGRSQAKRSSS